MSLYIQGTKKTITEAMIMEAAEGELCETYKKPLRYIHLLWAGGKQKKVAHNSKSKGFEDTFLTRRRAGGITITHRIPGSARWLLHPLSGKYTATLADTEQNRRTLASNYYDKLWVIKEADVDAEVKIEADKIDESLAKETVTYMIDKPIRDENGSVVKWVQEQVTESALEYQKRRREAQFKKGNLKINQSTVQPMELKPDPNSAVAQEKAEIAKKLAELKEREANIAIAEEALRKSAEAAKEPEPTAPEELNTEYSKEDLSAMRPISKLRKIAKELETTKDTSKMVTGELVDEILKLQDLARVPETTPISETVEELTP